MRSGITAPGSGITTLGIGISSVLVESGIKIVNVFGIRDQNSQCFCDQGLKFSTFLWSGIKIWGKNTGSVMKNIPCYDPANRNSNKKEASRLKRRRKVVRVLNQFQFSGSMSWVGSLASPNVLDTTARFQFLDNESQRLKKFQVSLERCLIDWGQYIVFSIIGQQ